MGRYAEGTDVSVERSQAEIKGTLIRYGAKKYLLYEETDHAVVMFEMQGWRLQFRLMYPALEAFKLTAGGQRRQGTQMQAAQTAEIKRLWRSLAMVIKAKLESISSGIESFEQAFMANIMLPGQGNSTVSDWLIPQLQQSYLDNTMPPMLSDGR